MNYDIDSGSRLRILIYRDLNLSEDFEKVQPQRTPIFVVAYLYAGASTTKTINTHKDFTMQPIGFYTSYTPGEGGLLQDMEESWGSTFEVLTPYQRVYLLAALSTEIFSQYELENNENDSEVEEVCERLGELGFGDLLGLMEALINQAKHRRG
jgi:hypothetical protein